MGVDSSAAPNGSAERLRRWERAGGTWRVVARSVDGHVTVAFDSCSGEEMERLTSGEPALISFIGTRETSEQPLDSGPFFHGTKSRLEVGDLLEAGRNSNFGEGRAANFVYLTATMDAAIWGAELATGDGRGRIYRVEPTGEFENDPNLTDRRFPGNPTRSYRTRAPLRVVEEIDDWEGHPPEVLQEMLDHLAELKRQGIEAINE